MTATQDVLIPMAGARDLRAALAQPAIRQRRGAAVILLHELFGLDADIRRIAGRFADEGYVALAPDFLSGLGPRPFCMIRFMRALGKGTRGRPFRQLDAARGWLATREDVDTQRIGVAGFCIGGGFALLYAAGGAVATVAPFYAAVPDDPERTLAGICPVVASYGGRDRVFGAHGARLDAALATLGVDHDVKTYPDAGHSFMNELGGPLGWLARRTPMHAGFHPASAEDAWARTIGFFGRHLAQPAGASVPVEQESHGSTPHGTY
jgi:carboxymethylenebutenolidase